MTAPISKQPWDEDAFFEHAAMHRSVAELAQLQSLVSHANSTGGRLNWRRGGLPGASVWYRIGGRSTAVYGFSAGDASTPSHVLLYLSELPELLSPEQLALVRAELHDTNADQECWTTRLFVLADLATESAESILRLITTIIDRATQP